MTNVTKHQILELDAPGYEGQWGWSAEDDAGQEYGLAGFRSREDASVSFNDWLDGRS